jgi:subtilisin family serine protease
MKATLLSASIAAVLFGALSPLPLAAQAESGQVSSAPSTYLIEFEQPGMLRFQRQLTPGQRFDPQRLDTVLYRNELISQQAEFKAGMNAALGREVKVTHHYLASHSGIAAELTAEEAAAIARMPGVAKVNAETVEVLHTQRGPAFIGANTIWDGSNVPGGVGTRGEGMVIATLDSGAVLPHPSFNNDAACGHGTTQPEKVLSALDCSSTDIEGLCNGASAIDTNGHGTHTASTSGGNRVDQSAVPPPAFTTISGVAPCASLRIYKVCPGSSCPGADIAAGLEGVLLHGDVSVMNFSISGGLSPWGDNDRIKLDLVEAGVLVAASAGNTRAETPNPVGQVNHRGPWVLSVAASTHDETGASGLLSVTGPGTPPANLANIPMTRGSASPNGVNQVNLPIRHFTGQPVGAEGCTASTPFPADFFDGAAALIHRGTCAFTEKAINAFNAGAEYVIIRNNATGALSPSTPGQPAIPVYAIPQTEGNALVAFVDANPTTTTINTVITPVPGDKLADFSLRGPTPGSLVDLQKPNITGPGVNIYAAITDATSAPLYGLLSGTSMSSPHLAGAATLVRAVQPTWTPTEVISAIQMTAVRAGQKDLSTAPWDWDDVGSGRVDLTRATKAGLLMDESIANFLAANPAAGGDVKTLNLPSVRDVSCNEEGCSFTRTVRSVLADPVMYAVSVDQPEGFEVEVSPSNFSLTQNQTQVLTITATPVRFEPGTAIRFGAINLTSNVGAPVQHITVALQGQGQTEEIFLNGFETLPVR